MKTIKHMFIVIVLKWLHFHFSKKFYLIVKTIQGAPVSTCTCTQGRHHPYQVATSHFPKGSCLIGVWLYSNSQPKLPRCKYNTSLCIVSNCSAYIQGTLPVLTFARCVAWFKCLNPWSNTAIDSPHLPFNSNKPTACKHLPGNKYGSCASNSLS